MNIYALLQRKISDISKQTFGEIPHSLVRQITVEQPRNLAQGDVATNIALVLCKWQNMTPKKMFDTIYLQVKALNMVRDVRFCSPGFINMDLKDGVWQQLIDVILSKRKDFGSSSLGARQPINVEYASANPTGALHVGHARISVFGDVLAKLLEKVGFIVTREYYINDAGGQITILARSAYMRYRQACGETLTDHMPAGLYPGAYLKAVGKVLKDKFGNSLLHKTEEVWLVPVARIAVRKMLEIIVQDLHDLGIKHHVFCSEQNIIDEGGMKEALAILKEKDLLYTGILEPPKSTVSLRKSRPQTLFRSTRFGDDKDRPLSKPDGSPTYFSSDIAYHLDKYKRGFKKQVAIWGADHGGYVKRLCGAVDAISDGEVSLRVKICQMVKVKKAGKLLKMSKRKGDFFLLQDLIKAVGRDSIRFSMMMRKAEAPLDFDVESVKDSTQDTSVFYIQYAHARCCSVLRQAQAQGLSPAKGHSRFIRHPSFIHIVKTLSLFPRIVESAAEHFEPHKIAFYLLAVAEKFHQLWAEGARDDQVRFLDQENTVKSNSSLMVVRAVKTVLENGLDIFSIQAKERM